MWQEYVEIIAADLKRWSESPVEWVIRVSAAVFAVFFVIIFVFDSSMAFGLSLGLTGFLSRVMMLGLAVVLSALCWSLLFYLATTAS